MLKSQPGRKAGPTVPAPTGGVVPASSSPGPGSTNGNMSTTGCASATTNRVAAGRGRSTGKGPPQSPVFEGVYNNSRMLHFLTAVVGSTCDVHVRNNTVYEGIFKTLSSKIDLAVDAVHKKTSEEVCPKREEITDTMIFSPSDVILVRFKNVDLNYATKDRFTDSAIVTNSKVNGEHKEKVLQRWEGGDSNSDDYDLESDMSNGWDANDMFKFNEENYGVKTTYDSSLSLYTVPLEKENSEEFRQREARASQLAKEIESSPQYRQRISIENDDGRTDEEKLNSIQRPLSDRDSPSMGTRDGKYVPLPQRVREGSRGGMRTSSLRGGRPGQGSLPSRHHPESSSSPVPAEQRVINGGSSRMSPKSQRPPRGAKQTTSPTARPVESPSCTTSVAVTRSYPPRSPKSGSSAPSVSSQDSPVSSAATSAPTSPPEPRMVVETSSSPRPTSPKMAAPAPPVTLDVKDIQGTSTRDISRPVDTSGTSELAKSVNKGLQSEQKRSEIEELRNFSGNFRLQPRSPSESGTEVFVSRPKDIVETKLNEKSLAPESSVLEGCVVETPVAAVLKPNVVSMELMDTSSEKSLHIEGTERPVHVEGTDRQIQAGSPESKMETEEKDDAPVSEQVKKSTLNPNAKEFNPSKPLLSVNKSTSTPTSPGPAPRSHPAHSIQVIPGQSGMYSAATSYVPYLQQLHMAPTVQPPQIYPYPVSTSVQVQQNKYRGATKGSGGPQRSDQHQSSPASALMQAAAAAGAPLVAASYPSFVYNTQQFPGQPTMVPAMAHYQAQPFPMIPGNTRMLTGPQAIVPSSTPQYAPTEQGVASALYAPVPQPYPHHGTPLHPHQPQQATTPTGSQPQPQHAAPSPVQVTCCTASEILDKGSLSISQEPSFTICATLLEHQPGQPPHLAPAQAQQSMYHPSALAAAAPQSITPAPNAQSPQSSFQQQPLYIHPQQLSHSYASMPHVTQTHVQHAPPPTHPGGPHAPQVMLLSHPQPHGGPPQAALPQSGVQAMSASSSSPYQYLGHHQVGSHAPQPLPFHSAGN
ncbi:ataxin-2-like protein isoform X2 [Protopterus annectens]|uniref:ataxin-2-like protein isoform X2 n=1 Tax=Protopterus annectens TaxID=7888 RepID=UPI001CF937F3|nr:ataxin-2-like protein isoform X2 [Protopterus annectens]